MMLHGELELRLPNFQLSPSIPKVISMAMAAKLQRHNGSNHERFLGMSTVSYGYHGDEDAHDDRKLEDMIEEDAWYSSIDETVTCDSREEEHVSGEVEEHNPTPPWRGAHTPRNAGGLSLAFREPLHSSPPRVLHQSRTVETGHNHRRQHVASSAPVSVPNWSKILRVNSAELVRSPAANDVSGDDDDAGGGSAGEWLPPHEYLARASVGSGGTVGASVLEGAGRTLKGRDMSRVRNKVWRQTGFFG